jgi:hypothetical protein
MRSVPADVLREIKVTFGPPARPAGSELPESIF